MKRQLVILDFDGTFTDSEAEGAPFAAIYPQLIADATGAGPRLLEVWPQALQCVRDESPAFGWRMNGLDAAPADADPYIRCSMAAHRALDWLGLVREPAARDKLLAETYQSAYKHSAIAFRPQAGAALQALLDRGIAVAVVTNSSTGHVQHKIAQLGLTKPVDVFGNAMKFWVSSAPLGVAAFDALPDREPAAGLPRPLWLKRDRYFQRIADLWQTYGADAESTTVCGDIYELDLALPAALGARVALMRRANTYDYELAAVQAKGARGLVLDNLADFAAWVG